MANRFTSERDPGAPSVRMSNATTAAVFDLLAIAGTARAQTDWEKALVYFLIEHDQARVGLGTVGFDLFELGWTEEGFDEQRRFVLGVIDAALGISGEHLLPPLTDLRRLCERFPRSAIETSAPTDAWRPGALPTEGVCEVHQVYLHELGCIVCNDAPVVTGG